MTVDNIAYWLHIAYFERSMFECVLRWCVPISSSRCSASKHENIIAELAQHCAICTGANTLSVSFYYHYQVYLHLPVTPHFYGMKSCFRCEHCPCRLSFFTNANVEKPTLFASLSTAPLSRQHGCTLAALHYSIRSVTQTIPHYHRWSSHCQQVVTLVITHIMTFPTTLR